MCSAQHAQMSGEQNLRAEFRLLFRQLFTDLQILKSMFILSATTKQPLKHIRNAEVYRTACVCRFFYCLSAAAEDELDPLQGNVS